MFKIYNKLQTLAQEELLVEEFSKVLEVDQSVNHPLGN